MNARYSESDSAPVKRVLLILNPVSGQKDYEKVKSRLIKKLESVSVVWELKETGGAADALCWAREAKNLDRLIVGGGDGTVMEALSGLIEGGSGIPLAQIPLGTGNLLARALGVPTDPEKALDLALGGGTPVKLDAGHLCNRNQYFSIMVGAGWDARTVADSSRKLKNRLGFFAYVFSGIRNFFTIKNAKIEITVDGEKYLIRGHTVFVINIGSLHEVPLGLGKNISPRDGVLNVIVTSARTPIHLLRLLWGVLRNDSRGISQIQSFSGKDIRVAATPALPVQIDGETSGKTPFHARVVESAVTMITSRDYAARVKTPCPGKLISSIHPEN